MNFPGSRLDGGRPQPINGAVLHHAEWILDELHSEGLQLVLEGIHVDHDNRPMSVL